MIPTPRMKLPFETGMIRVASGLRYFVQSVKKFVYLSRPATIGTRPYVSRIDHHGLSRAVSCIGILLHGRRASAGPSQGHHARDYAGDVAEAEAATVGRVQQGQVRFNA